MFTVSLIFIINSKKYHLAVDILSIIFRGKHPKRQGLLEVLMCQPLLG